MHEIERISGHAPPIRQCKLYFSAVLGNNLSLNYQSHEALDHVTYTIVGEWVRVRQHVEVSISTQP